MKKILIIKLGALGDFIQALGPMRAIRNHHKNAHITLLTTRPFKTLAQSSGYFDDIWIDTKPSKIDIIGWLSLRKKLNNAGFTRIYDLQNSDRTALYFKLLKSPKPDWSGAAKGASHANLSPARTAGHAFDGHVQTLALAGITDITIDTLDWIKTDIAHIKPSGKYALIVPGCAPGREEKRWPPSHYAALCQHLAREGIIPLILGTAHEQTLAQTITDQTGSTPQNLAGKTSLQDIATLAHDATLAIGNDTGPMHIIAATGCPSLTLFSRHSNPTRHYPKGVSSTTLFEENLETLSTKTVIAALPL